MPSVHKAIVAPEFSLQGAAARPFRGEANAGHGRLGQIGAMYLSAALNAVALVALLVFQMCCQVNLPTFTKHLLVQSAGSGLECCLAARP